MATNIPIPDSMLTTVLIVKRGFFKIIKNNDMLISMINIRNGLPLVELNAFRIAELSKIM